MACLVRCHFSDGVPALAKAICACANAELPADDATMAQAPRKPVAGAPAGATTVEVQGIGSPGPPQTRERRDERDAVRRAVDVALTLVAPQLDFKDLHVTFPSGCTALVHIMPDGRQRRHVQGVRYLACPNGPASDDAWSVVRATADPSHKPSRQDRHSLRAARAVVDAVFSPQIPTPDQLHALRQALSTSEPVTGKLAIRVATCRGVQATLAVFAVCHLYAYVACRSADPTGPWAVVGKVPRPRALASVPTTGRGIGRAVCGVHVAHPDIALHFAREMQPLANVAGSVVHTVTVVARALEVALGEGRQSVIALDDTEVVGAAADVAAVETVCSAAALIGLACDACATVRHTRAALSPKLSSWVSACQSQKDSKLFTHKVAERRAALRARDALCPAQLRPGRAPPPRLSYLQDDESEQLEFKHHAAQWRESGTAAAPVGKKSTADTERLRRTVVAFANTCGGCLVVGANDAGQLLGAAGDTAAVRTGGFAPAIVAEMIVSRQVSLAAAGASSSAPGQAAAPAKEWWKNTGEVPTTSTSGGGGGVSAHRVTVLCVAPAAAPFTCVAPGVQPAMRGAASTVRMSLSVAAERLAAFPAFAADATEERPGEKRPRPPTPPLG